MELTGKIVAVLPEQRGNGKKGEWLKNAFVVEWSDNGYTQRLCLEVIGQEKWEKMQQSVAVGNNVVVRFGVASREWNQKWFTTASCWYCSSVGGSGGDGAKSQDGGGGSSDGGSDAVPF